MHVISIVSCGIALCALIMGGAHAGMREEPISALPTTMNVAPDQSALGRLLFNDVRLSGNGKVSCATCHNTDLHGGADGKQLSGGLHGDLTAVNTPTVLNAAFNFRQFWDGRASSLESQIEEVIKNPKEMGSNWSSVLALVANDPSYRKLFANAYLDGVTKNNIQNAIASYERTLITPNSRFDLYLRGNARALTAQEHSGYAKFKSYGCVACHQGRNIGGNMFQKFGVMQDYFAARGRRTKADFGRYLVTGISEDKFVFKVPTLRNIAQTAPYFHDGSTVTLEDAVDVMFRYQLGRVPNVQDRSDIVAFLKTLSGMVSQ